MPRAFDITPASTSATLDDHGRAELSFSVSNKLGKPVRARAVAEPEGQTQRGWLNVDPEAERELAHDGTTNFTVKVAVPKGAPQGTYSMHLLVSSVSNPDEDYAHGPGVTFTVAPTPEGPPFPWWIVGLVAGVVLIGVVSIILYSVLSGSGVGDKCDPKKQKDCSGELVCSPRGADFVCLVAQVGGACKKGEDCVTERCESNKCSYPKPGAGCSAAGATCPANQKCVELEGGAKSCLLKPAERCGANTECSALWCRNDGVCARDDNKCDKPDECLPPMECYSGRCALKNGLKCDEDQRCISGSCENNICQIPAQTCFPACPKNFYCQRGQCRPILILKSNFNSVLHLNLVTPHQ